MPVKRKIVFIPIDNRPVCYDLPKQIAQMDESIELLLPKRQLLGDLKNPADMFGIYDWLERIKDPEAIIISLDTMAYGGLIPSRKSDEIFKEVYLRMLKFRHMLEEKKTRIYAFSSIMRISNNNVNEEEKDYWNPYGKEIFKYSYDLHKDGVAITDVPSEIIQDYILTRKRNFDMNIRYLEWQEEGVIDTLVFSKDDSGEYGLNVQEAEYLQEQIKRRNLSAMIKTGADEIPLSLLCRAITAGKKYKIAPIYTNPDYTDKISKYEDVTVAESVKGQIELAGGVLSNEENADIIMVVNNFKKHQGELVMDVETEGFKGKLFTPDKPYFAADILNANGADNNFVEKLMELDLTSRRFLGYAGWNTTGNTLGSAICAAMVKYFARKYNDKAFRKLQLTRFLDDWAYQANVRKYLKMTAKTLDLDKLKNTISPFEMLVNKVFKTNYQNITYEFPWRRYFEIEVDID